MIRCSVSHPVAPIAKNPLKSGVIGRWPLDLVASCSTYLHSAYLPAHLLTGEIWQRQYQRELASAPWMPPSRVKPHGSYGTTGRGQSPVLACASVQAARRHIFCNTAWPVRKLI